MEPKYPTVVVHVPASSRKGRGLFDTMNDSAVRQWVADHMQVFSHSLDAAAYRRKAGV